VKLTVNRITKLALVMAVFGTLFTPARAQDNSPRTNIYLYEMRGPSRVAQPVMTPLEVMEYSKERVVLYVGSDSSGTDGYVLNIRGIVSFLTELGWRTEIAYPTNEPGPLQVPIGKFAVFANGRFGGLYTQRDIDRGIGAEIEIFARNSGVPRTNIGTSN
jgi:hypothetical protein